MLYQIDFELTGHSFCVKEEPSSCLTPVPSALQGVGRQKAHEGETATAGVHWSNAQTALAFVCGFAQLYDTLSSPHEYLIRGALA